MEEIQTGSNPQECEANSLSTPKQARHKRVNALKVVGGKTPTSSPLQVPASPMLKMLGYGSGKS
jgi:hypothetical protein